MYSITLNDGTTITDLELNGNNFISQDEVDEEIFTPDNLKHIQVSDGENVEEFDNLMLSNFWEADDGTHIIFRDKTPSDLLQERLEEYDAALVELADIIVGKE